jgi:hypothetical protein
MPTLLGKTRNSPVSTRGGGAPPQQSGARVIQGSGDFHFASSGNAAQGRTGKLSTAFNRGAYLVVIPASGFINFPNAVVPNDATVRIRAHNGTNAGNTNPIGLCDSAEQARAIQAAADFMNPDDEVIYPADNLGRIWVRGTPGDGAIASIRSGGPA